MKCCSTAGNDDLSISVVVGGTPSEPKAHNFANEPVCKMPEVWSFVDLMDTDSDSLEIVLQVMLVEGSSEASSAVHVDSEPSDAEPEKDAYTSPFTDACVSSTGAVCSNSVASGDVEAVVSHCDESSLRKFTNPVASGTLHDIREGDWYCPKCADFQFGRNSACRMCGEPKPELRPQRSQPWLQAQPQMCAAVYLLDGATMVNDGQCVFFFAVPVNGELVVSETQTVRPEDEFERSVDAHSYPRFFSKTCDISEWARTHGPTRGRTRRQRSGRQ